MHALSNPPPVPGCHRRDMEAPILFVVAVGRHIVNGFLYSVPHVSPRMQNVKGRSPCRGRLVNLAAWSALVHLPAFVSNMVPGSSEDLAYTLPVCQFSRWSRMPMR